MHTASSDPSVYAICEGQICVQEVNGNPNLVNLILSPSQQPTLNFVPIKYIIYKGVLKNSLVLNDSEIASQANNDLTNNIWNSQKAKNVSAGTNDNAPKEALGIHYSANAPIADRVLDSDSIDKLFYRANVDFQLTVVKSGWSIGKFDKTKFGIEIIFESIEFDPPAEMVRKLENIIQVPALSGNETQSDFFKHWHDKEAILNFMDPCAFYGSFYTGKIQVKVSTGSFSTKSGNDLYSDVLIKFINKNRIYIDIRNEHNFSFNYYKNYGTDIVISYDSNSQMAIRNYYNDLWPLLMLDETDFASTNTTIKNIVRLSLPESDNTLPVVYLSQGYTAASFPSELKSGEKFLTASYTGTGFTSEISMSVPNNNALGNTTPVSSYLRLKYFRKFDTTQPMPVSSGTVIKNANYLDNLFFPLDLKIPFETQQSIKTNVYDADLYIDAIKDIGIDFIGKVGIAEDNMNVTLFAFPLTIKSGEAIVQNTPFSLSGEIIGSSDTYLNVLTNRYSPKSIEKSSLLLNPVNVDYVSFMKDETADVDFKMPNFDYFIGLALDKPTFTNLQQLALSSFPSGYRVFLGIKNIRKQVDGIGISYISYELVLRGLEVDNNILQVKEVFTDSANNYTTNLTIYSNANT